jgi:hypothetical protein
LCGDTDEPDDWDPIREEITEPRGNRVRVGQVDCTQLNRKRNRKKDASQNHLHALNSVNTDEQIHIHCFTDSPEFARRLLDHFPNLFIGITG